MKNSNSMSGKHGPWYWVFLRPRWELIAAPADCQDVTWGHPRVWRELVIPRLTLHCRLTSSQVVALKEVPYAMPRGRVSLTNSRNPHWVLWNGNDLPKAIPFKQAYRKLITAFDLKTDLRMGIVQTRYDEHERMLPHDVAILENILGPIPFAPHLPRGSAGRVKIKKGIPRLRDSLLGFPPEVMAD